ncbi:6-phospho-3-hexuloisomerase [Paenibacillus caui]|uniref:6-phospho-3-hexuloisomerase n=1 Tax=Paenibacillus caui TaxID=2873927 RepID=UPI001CA8C872|nr:6-phospho-3-hexuloisomerase [Paenibacillus caui]
MNFAAEIVKELEHSIRLISEEEISRLARVIMESRQVFVAGAGRSGLMGRAFAMRLMHTGIPSFVVGETITPGIGAGDVLIIGSGSGETKSLASMAEKANGAGASVVAVTIHPESTIGTLASTAIKLPGSPKDKASGSYHTMQPMASLFEQTLLVFYDAVILRLMEAKGLNSGLMYGNHANLE